MVSLDLAGPEVRPLNPIFLGADRRGWLEQNWLLLMQLSYNVGFNILFCGYAQKIGVFGARSSMNWKNWGGGY
ncbi:hypothetical protein DBR11_28705 [Pedobacter sp. HMWF019]|nr:hypothetical protein DBR11_28705 [Pedobacter sp. HMWF019]